MKAYAISGKPFAQGSLEDIAGLIASSDDARSLSADGITGFVVVDDRGALLYEKLVDVSFFRLIKSRSSTERRSLGRPSEHRNSG